MSEEYKEVEQTESKAEPIESGADKETENVADKEAEQTGAEMESVKETDQTQKTSRRLLPRLLPYHRMSLSIRVSMNRSINGKKKKRSLLLYQFLWAELFFFVILYYRSGSAFILIRIHILTDRMYLIIQ